MTTAATPHREHFEQHRPSARGEPAWEIALAYPAQGYWTVDDYLSLDIGRMVEFSDGFIEVLPMPTLPHQFIAQFLHRALDDFVTARRLGRACLAPLPVRLWPSKFREPDVMYFSSERLRDADRYPSGADLVMEIPSEGSENRRRDFDTKRREYAAAGIGEYWIVDAERREITILTLAGSEYREHGVFRGDDLAVSLLLPEFSVRAADVFAAGENPLPPE